MSGTTLRTIITLALIFHGVGHLMGVFPALGLLDTQSGSSQGWLKNWSSRSWLLTDLIGEGPSRVLGVILYGLAFAGFVATGLALAGWGLPHDAWRTLAILSAIVSLAAVLLFWDALILLFPHKVGALGVNIAVVVGLLVANWPGETALGF
jgi:hypothetical protein